MNEVTEAANHYLDNVWPLKGGLPLGGLDISTLRHCVRHGFEAGAYWREGVLPRCKTCSHFKALQMGEVGYCHTFTWMVQDQFGCVRYSHV